MNCELRTANYELLQVTKCRLRGDISSSSLRHWRLRHVSKCPVYLELTPFFSAVPLVARDLEHTLARPVHMDRRGHKAGRHTLKITIQNEDKAIAITLEGRVAGPWVAELSRVWVETAPQLGQKAVIIDLRSVIYADALGKEALREIYAQTHATLLASSPWAQYLAEEIAQCQAQA